MGLFWDLMQESKIAETAQRADAARQQARSTAARVKALEDELAKTNALLAEVIRRLEVQSGEDINKDGRIG